MQIPISIIIPVYNAEKTIERCLNSILSQSFKNFEVIIIDDGSTDSSYKICKDYAKTDSRIIVIHKKNEGIGITRQIGLDLAKGIYTIHVDSDDWIEPDMLENLYNYAIENNSDMVICDFKRVYRDHCEVFKQSLRSSLQSDLIEDLIKGVVWGCCWNKLIKTCLFQKFKIRFIPTMNLWEDLYVICALLEHPLQIGYVEKALYNYDCFSNDNSIVRNRNINHVQSGMTFIDTFEKVFSCSQYDYGWYRRKTMVKRWIFKLETNSYDVKNVYPEINNQFILELKNAAFGTENYCLALCLKGFPKTGKCLFKIMNKLYHYLPLI